MFRAFIKDDSIGMHFETLTRLHSYRTLQQQIADALAPYEYVVERYSKISGNNIHSVNGEYLKDHPKISEQNVILLKNAIELWREASRTTESVAPVLYHYSLHCFISFFNYTFFRWEPEHASSHGINISKWNDNIPEIEIEVSKRGIFQRLIDTWTLLGACLAFSPFLPIFEGEKIEFIPNRRFLLQESNILSLRQLQSFKPDDFERDMNSDLGDKRIQCPFTDSISGPNYDLRNYLIIFLASSIARYRPLLWNSVLVGETSEQSDFSLTSTGALSRIAGNLRNIYSIFQEIRNQKFELRKTLRQIK